LQRVNLVSLAQQVIEQQRPAAGDRELVIEADQPELMVVCDSLRIRQVLTNLIGNAIRYSPPATTVLVGLSRATTREVIDEHGAYVGSQTTIADPDEMLAVICVQDQGAGISPEQAAELFKRYARGQERRGEGLGLGLYLSREFVNRHGGIIWIESLEGQGSTFYVALPLEQPAELLIEQADPASIL